MAEEYANGGETGQYADSQMQYNQGGSYEEQGGTTAGGDGTPGDKINASKNDDDESSMARKIFVGGLSWETTVKDMREYFSKYGEVLDCTLKTDPATGRSRGFGFVLFGQTSSVDKVFEEQSHMLHGKTIDPKKAKARGGKEPREPIKKVFVGGLDPEVPESEIRQHFQPFGKIEEIDLPYDKMKGQRRAFCFVTFESEEVVDKVCEQSKQQIGSKEVDVKKATPKNERNYDGGYGYGGRGRGGYGGRGRGRGDSSSYNSGSNWGNQGNYNYGDYYNQGGYGGTGYDYYGQSGYGGYDYNNYYNQGWGGYNQGGYGGGGGYGQGGSTGYNQSGGYGAQQGGYKAQRGGGGGKGYHPYSR